MFYRLMIDQLILKIIIGLFGNGEVGLTLKGEAIDDPCS